MLPVFEHIATSQHSSWNFYARQASTFPFDWHYHEEYELTLIIAGSGQRYVGDSVQRYEPGDLILIGSNIPHTWRSEQAGWQSAMTCQFLPGFLGSAFFSAPEFSVVNRMLQRSALGLRFESDANAERDRMRSMGDLEPAQRTISLLNLLADLSKKEASVLSTVTLLPPTEAAGQRRIEEVLQYVDQEYRNDVTLEAAAVAIGMTTRSLSRFFRARTSRTFTNYVNDVRCAAASRMLIETELPIARVATECGYANLSNFNRRFRERLGLTPHNYRSAFTPI